MSVTTPNNIDLNKILFTDPEAESFEKGKQRISYFRMKMWYGNTESRFYIQAPKLYSFGVQEAKSMEDETKITGYDCNFVLINKPNEHLQVRTDDDGNEIQPTWEELGANHDEMRFLNLLESIYDKVCKKLLEVKTKCGLGKIKNLDAMKEKVSPPWHFAKNKETKMPDYTRSPTLKSKLSVNFKNGIDEANIYSRFYNENDDKLKVTDYIGQRMYVIPALAFESIYIGDAYVTFQIKLPEAVIFPAESMGGRRLLKHVTSNINKLMSDDTLANEPFNPSDDNIKSSGKTKIGSVKATLNKSKSIEDIDDSPSAQKSENEQKSGTELKKSLSGQKIIRPLVKKISSQNLNKTSSSEINNLLGNDD